MLPASAEGAAEATRRAARARRSPPAGSVVAVLSGLDEYRNAPRHRRTPRLARTLTATFRIFTEGWPALSRPAPTVIPERNHRRNHGPQTRTHRLPDARSRPRRRDDRGRAHNAGGTPRGNGRPRLFGLACAAKQGARPGRSLAEQSARPPPSEAPARSLVSTGDRSGRSGPAPDPVRPPRSDRGDQAPPSRRRRRRGRDRGTR
jgi:hypothetical protein